MFVFVASHKYYIGCISCRVQPWWCDTCLYTALHGDDDKNNYHKLNSNDNNIDNGIINMNCSIVI